MSSEQKPTASTRDQILTEHCQIAALAGGLVEKRDLEQIAGGLNQLLPLLERHFAREEAQEGLHGGLRTQAPQVAAAIEHLQHDHRRLLTDAGELRSRVRGCLDGPVREIHDRCLRLLRDLQQHEARENELFLDTVWTDLGTGD